MPSDDPALKGMMTTLLSQERSNSTDIHDGTNTMDTRSHNVITQGKSENAEIVKVQHDDSHSEFSGSTSSLSSSDSDSSGSSSSLDSDDD